MEAMMKIEALRRFFIEPYIVVRIVPTGCLPCLHKINRAPYASDPRPVVVWFDIQKKPTRK